MTNTTKNLVIAFMLFICLIIYTFFIKEDPKKVEKPQIQSQSSFILEQNQLSKIS